jgi:hypothetical protein
MRNRLNRWLLGATSFVALAAFAPSAARAACMDANNNGSVTGTDCLQIAREALGLSTNPDPICPPGPPTSCADANSNGGVDLSDSLLCFRQVNGLANTIIPCATPPTPVACGAVRSGNINNSEIWQECPGGTSVTLNGPTFVQAGVTITVQPGAKVEANPGVTATLVFLRGSRIIANGNPTKPIIFTSNSPPKSTGDWGGIVLNGFAQANCGGDCFSEGFDPMVTPVSFGGSDDNDTSGIMKYVRVEFSGITLSFDNELNTLTMNAVGRSTQMDHIQTHRGDDDCFEWFGGAVDAKFLVASGCLDDLLDTQLGYRGRIQYALAIQELTGLDTGDRHAFEWDNNETVQGATPFNEPKMCNVTAVGTKNQGGSAGGKEGARLRRGTAGVISNTIISDFERSGLRVRDNTTTCKNIYTDHPSPCTTLKTTSPFLVVRDTLLFDDGPGATGTTFVESECAAPCNVQAAWTASRNLQVGADPGYATANPTFPTSASDANKYVPTVGSNADTLVTTSCNATLADGFFDASADYAGAFAPNNTPANSNWLITPGPWINFNLTN